MPRTVYQGCVETLKEKQGQTINLDELKALIMMHIGGCQRTIDQALKVMEYTKLIKDVGNFRFEIRPMADKCNAD